ncbi:Clavaminate synthase-like protein [Lindgomyces ingoldianus]|uniref:Clavaminate synthase-like protein n=1 Tax=Lindgomyces ingoldianus TaxID=673940 RepID=A0ACB6RH46_9PLEO|nr:Clavaminate synthase-like protein [Lindgomyces ingoldianus]KAF2477665.1 Clavaminate synthase-like protein [Lindgomyces ingoldianus]
MVKFKQPGFSSRTFRVAAGTVERQYDIGQGNFNLPLEDKGDPKYRCNFAQGNYFGYRAAHEKKVMRMDDLDNVESANIPKFISAYENEPFYPFFHQYRADIENFSQRSLELAAKHLYEEKSEDFLRYMIYWLRSPEDDRKVENTWSRAHNDFGSLTLPWSQKIAGLQLKTLSGEWKYVPPVDNGIICNVGNTLDFWSAGYLKSTTHRVVRPPRDQSHIHRLGLFYFVRAGDEVDISPPLRPCSSALVASEMIRRLQHL